jgi:hypothetical protein
MHSLGSFCFFYFFIYGKKKKINEGLGKAAKSQSVREWKLWSLQRGLSLWGRERDESSINWLEELVK